LNALFAEVEISATRTAAIAASACWAWSASARCVAVIVGPGSSLAPGVWATSAGRAARGAGGPTWPRGHLSSTAPARFSGCGSRSEPILGDASIAGSISWASVLPASLTVEGNPIARWAAPPPRAPERFP